MTSLGYQGITINIGNKNGLGKPPVNVGTPLAKDAALREAFDAAIDRKGIAKIVYDNGVEPGCSPISPVSPFHDASQHVPAARRRQGEEARQGERRDDAGAGDADAQHRRGSARLGQVIQAMTKEAGFDVKLQPTEFATALDKGDAGEYDTFQLGWSGRVDPDGDIYEFAASKGALNDSGYSNPRLDALIDKARETNDEAAAQGPVQAGRRGHQPGPAADLPVPREVHHRREQEGRRAEGVRRRAAAVQGGRPDRRLRRRCARSSSAGPARP